ncbi:uncharacterized protein LOC142785089 isoform X2 [Rhipicephalus microplus]|uniref:uncharacterized protein LOC142785089 isoform X2 n=1 Tax=Rhipicephalus microplus TaxID=6941 RepID=UPI003F6AB937
MQDSGRRKLSVANSIAVSTCKDCPLHLFASLFLLQLSRLDQHVSQQMNLHWVASHAYIRMFIPFLSVMKGAEDYISEDATYVVKNILQVGALRDLLTSKPREVLAYMAFHTTVYLAPFLQGKEDLWGFAMFMLTKTQRPQPVPKWRLCLRLVDRLLPGPLLVAIELVDASTPFFADIMAEVMIEEVRSSFIEEVMAIERLESWTKHMLTVKIQEEIPWKKESPFEYFLNVSAFMVKDWASPIRHPLIEQRRGLSLFDSDCQFNPHRNVEVVPLAMFNLSMPTSARERMFHIPRIGTRISTCLFRATFSDNFYRHTDMIPMKHTSKHVNNTLNCLTPHYKNKGQEMSGFEKVEDCTAVIVAYKTFQTAVQQAVPKCRLQTARPRKCHSKSTVFRILRTEHVRAARPEESWDDGGPARSRQRAPHEPAGICERVQLPS